jgi:hypothetical protein
MKLGSCLSASTCVMMRGSYLCLVILLPVFGLHNVLHSFQAMEIYKVA